jgi:lipid A 3-O-deacylase
VRKRLHAPGWPRAAALAALLLSLVPPAAARDLSAGGVSCALGPFGEGQEAEDGFVGSLFDVLDSVDAPCRLGRRGSLQPSSARLAAVPGTGAGLPALEHGAELSLTGPPLPGGGSVAAPPRPEQPAPRPRAEAPGEPLWGVISEVRFGALSHDIIFPGMRNLTAPDPFRHHFERGVNLNAEVDFVSPRFLRYLLSPRPRVGGSVNTEGYTSNAYVDLDWRWQLKAGPFFEGFLGGAVHDGKLRDANPRFAELGTRFLFHIGLEAGVRLYGRHGLSLFWEHMSNSALAHKNQGMDSAGLRYGYRFAE